MQALTFTSRSIKVTAKSRPYRSEITSMKKTGPFTLSLKLKLSLLAVLIVTLAFISSVVTPAGAQGGKTFAPGANSSTVATASSDPKITYPESKKVDAVDIYFGTKVPDPYRWLEEDKANAAEIAAWVEAQNRVTFSYLDRIPFRQQVKQRLE